jgi:hypothetical protein
MGSTTAQRIPSSPRMALGFVASLLNPTYGLAGIGRAIRGRAQ